ncbi:MAG: hypothetical protein R2854_06720 [Caldilineaceae bacterium]
MKHAWSNQDAQEHWHEHHVDAFAFHGGFALCGRFFCRRFGPASAAASSAGASVASAASSAASGAGAAASAHAAKSSSVTNINAINFTCLVIQCLLEMGKWDDGA